MIAFLGDPWRTAFLTVAVLALAAWFLNGHHAPHLPAGLLGVLGGQLAAAAAFWIATTEAARAIARARGRHTGAQHRTTTTNGDHHA